MPKENSNKKTSASVAGSIPVNSVKAPEQTTEPFIINNIILRNVDRTPKDVGHWREAHKSAESIYYPNRTRLYDLYMDVRLDGFLCGIINKRIDAVINKRFRFVNSKNEEVEDICRLVETNEFRSLIKAIMESIFWGISAFEFIPGDTFQFKEIPRKHIKPERKVIAVNQTDYDGIPYEDLSNVLVIGGERDLGLLLQCSFYALLKKGSFSDWAAYIEIFGQPMMVTKYDSFDEKTKMQLTKMMEDAGAALKMTIPKQADFEILDAKTSNGNGDLQKQFVDSCNEEMSIIILGNTETTTSSKSSGYAQSKTHQQQQFEVTKSDLLFIRALLNTDKFLSIVKSYGFQVEGGKFSVEEDVDVNNLLIRSQIDATLANDIKLPINDDYYYENYGIDKPDNYDELKKKIEESNQQVQIDPVTRQPLPAQKKPGKNLAADSPEFELGDRVVSLVNHMPGMKGMAGKITIVEDGPYYGVTFDGETKVHKWLVQDELKPEDESSPAKKKMSKMKMSAWNKLRSELADFFDPAHND